jgi:hypothetical protein
MIEALAFLIMVGVGVLQWRAGLFSAALLFCNVLLACFFAFTLWEPLAEILGMGEALDPYADLLALVILFVLGVGLLRMFTGILAPQAPAFPRLADRIGGAVFGAVTGYLAAAFLICTFHTLPGDRDFLGYHPREDLGLGGPDMVLLGLMSWASVEEFDPDAFVARYASRRGG